MMGATHAVTGAPAWVARTGFAAAPDGVLLGAPTTARVALISDGDHPRATVAHALPPLRNIITPGRPRITGGHRNGTHTHCSGWPVFTLLAIAALPLQLN